MKKHLLHILPRALRTPFEQFLGSESVGGLLLLLAAGAAFVVANTPWGEGYFALQSAYVGIQAGGWGLKLSLLHWINDGLMAIFFLMVGLEIKRELLIGELSRPRDAALSIFAALGGMVVPALIFAGFNAGTAGAPGWGIPMATDIAFAIGVISLLGPRVPIALKVFLTALAIVDDLGAVAVIAVFYTQGLHLTSLLLALGLLAVSAVYGLYHGHRLAIYGLLGVLSWYFMLQSGVHATVAGVLLAFTVPLSRRILPEEAYQRIRDIVLPDFAEEPEINMQELRDVLSRTESPLHRLEHALVPWVSYGIVPVFAFFNAGVALQGENAVLSPITLGSFLGLVLGKPIGIFAFSWLSARAGWSSKPSTVTWPQIFFAGVLGGIGFTMSFFIASLAYAEAALLDQAKLGVLSASVAAALAGLLGLYLVTRSSSPAKVPETQGNR